MSEEEVKLNQLSNGKTSHSSKTGRSGKVKIYVLACLVIILFCALIAMVILYVNKTDKKSETTLKSSEVRSSQPAPEDTSFAIIFKNPTVKNIPELRKVDFPATDEFSTCLWFKLDDDSVDSWLAFFMYTTVDIEGENDLMLWIKDKGEIKIDMRNEAMTLLEKDFKTETWTHLCWLWKSNGTHWIYLNGKLTKKSFGDEDEFQEKLPESSGNVLLGQDKDRDRINDSKQMFRGDITQFFILSKLLTEDEVASIYENKPPKDDIVVGWWQFKNTTRGSDIVESALPSDFLN